MSLSTKRCSRCKEVLPRDAFGPDRSASDALQHRCRECHRQQSRQRYYMAGERERIRQYELRPEVKKRRRERNRQFMAKPQQRIRKRERTAGWPKGLFEERWVSQAGLCDCCGVQMKRGGQTQTAAALDHNHITRQPRGLLCMSCNKAEGWVSKYGAKITAYLEKWGAGEQ